MDYFCSYIFIVEYVLNRSTLRHKNHQQSNITAGVCQQKRGRHGSHCGPPHIHTRLHSFPCCDIRFLFHHLMHSRGNIHRQIHHCAGGTEEDGGHKDLRQIQSLKTCIQQTFRIGHNRTMNLKHIRKYHAQDTSHQDSKERTADSCRTTAIKAIHQRNNQGGQH